MAWQAPAYADTDASGTRDKPERIEPTVPPVTVTAPSSVQRPSEQTGSYAVRRTNTATGLDLSPRETPQGLSVVTRPQMDDFKLRTANDVLSTNASVTVERVEQDRTYYTARGFDITNFQVDGIGQPFTFGNVTGDIDTAIFDRVEVLRGANGLMSSTGNPSATVNFIRKRPTSALQASGSLSYGSWNTTRLDTDVSSALNAAGTLRGRAVVAAEKGDSYLDRYHRDRQVLYGVIDADLGDNTTITAGYTYQNSTPRGSMWGALPLYDSNGNATDYERSTSTAADWSSWKSNSQTAFAEATHQFDNGWEGKAIYTHRQDAFRGRLFYMYGTPDAVTGLGLYSYPSRYDSDNRQNQFDLRASGPFSLAGRKHRLLFGASASTSHMKELSLYGNDVGTALPPLQNWTGDYPEPNYDASATGGNFKDRYRSLYGAVQLNPADALKVIVGANNTSARSEGESYGESHTRDDSATSPYVGAVYELSRSLSLYGGYTSIFSPQAKLDTSLQRLAPAKGNSKEMGIKAESEDKRLNGSIGLFRARQNNLATSAGYVGIQPVYSGVDTVSQGLELDAAGAITPRLKLNASATRLSIKDNDGKDVRTFVPRTQVRTNATWQVPGMDALKLGAALSWRADTHLDVSDSVAVKQKAYALLDLMASYDIDKHTSVALNVYNVTNEKYLTSLYWEQSFYGAPVNASVSLSWKY